MICLIRRKLNIKYYMTIMDLLNIYINIMNFIKKMRVFCLWDRSDWLATTELSIYISTSAHHFIYVINPKQNIDASKFSQVPNILINIPA